MTIDDRLSYIIKRDYKLGKELQSLREATKDSVGRRNQRAEDAFAGVLDRLELSLA